MWPFAVIQHQIFSHDAASRVDNQEKYTPAQSLIYARRRTELASK